MYIRNSKFPAQNSRERGRILLARSVSDSIRNSRKKFGTPFLSPSSTNDPKNRTRYTSAIGEQALFLEFHDFLNFSLIENLPEKRCKKSAIFWAHLRHLVSIKPSWLHIHLRCLAATSESYLFRMHPHSSLSSVVTWSVTATANKLGYGYVVLCQILIMFVITLCMYNI